MLTRMTRMAARMLTHMLTRMTHWLAGSHNIHTRPLPPTLLPWYKILFSSVLLLWVDVTTKNTIKSNSTDKTQMV